MSFASGFRHLKSFPSLFSLRVSLVLLLGAIAILLVADRFRELIDNRAASLAAAETELANVARDAAEAQADVVKEARTLLGILTALPESSISAGDGCRESFQRTVNEAPWLLRLSVFGVDGRAACSSEAPLPEFHIADRAYFKQALATRGFVLSDYIISRNTGEPIVIAAMPRVEGGEVTAVLIAVINLDWLNRLAADTGAAPGSVVLLLDSMGTVLSAHPRPEAWIGGDLTKEVRIRLALKAARGVSEVIRFNKEPWIVAHERLPDTQAVVVVMQPKSTILAPVDEAARYAFSKISLTALFAFFAVWLGGERLLMRPFEALTRSAARFGRGEMTTPVITDGYAPEFQVLGAAFNKMARDLAQRETELRKANDQLRMLATTDGLTGLANRRCFDEAIAAEWHRARREFKMIAVVLVDVDIFKKYNDRYGHTDGDRCLRAIAGVLSSAARRPGDLAARIGGEEFALLLPGSTLEHASAIAEKLRADIAALAIEHLDSETRHVTISVGVAAARPQQNSVPASLLDHADRAMYRAKRAGRDRVVQAEPELSIAS